MKLYTKTGDDGTTGLFGGGRVPKNHPRVEAYGTVDELNAALGLAAAALDLTSEGAAEASKTRAMSGNKSITDQFHHILSHLQSRLFDIGADLATPQGTAHESKVQRINDQNVSEIEQWIDEVESGNTPMKHFVMPGGTELAARLHLARTICRRAERLLVTLQRDSIINIATLIYINRVSDLLFAMARRANKEAGFQDVPWVPGVQ